MLGADFLKNFHLVVPGGKPDAGYQDIAQVCSRATCSDRRAAAQQVPIRRRRRRFSGKSSVRTRTWSTWRAGFRLPSTRRCTTSRPPATAHFRCLDAAKMSGAKAEFSKLEREGIIRRSSSTLSAPLHMVMKPDGTWRPCGNYHHLNLVTTPDSYSLPNIQDLSARLHGCSIFSKLDLRKGYYHIPVQCTSQ